MEEPTAAELETYQRVRAWIDAKRAGWAPAHLDRKADLRATATRPVQLNPDRSWNHAWSLYEYGYWFAANSLAEDYGGTEEAASLAYPILFLYRHYTELKLKSILFETVASISSSEMPGKVSDEHNLMNLWTMLSDLLKQHGKSKMLDGRKDIPRILAQLTDIDRNSMETRYALGKDLKTATLKRISAVDLQDVQQVMSTLRHDMDELEMLFQYVDECWWDEGTQD